MTDKSSYVENQEAKPEEWHRSVQSLLKVIAVDSVVKVDWPQLAVHLDLDRRSVDRAPVFEDVPLMPEDFEQRLEQHFHA